MDFDTVSFIGFDCSGSEMTLTSRRYSIQSMAFITLKVLLAQDSETPQILDLSFTFPLIGKNNNS